MVVRDEVKAAVKRGAAVLDAKGPANWRSLVKMCGPLTASGMENPIGEVGVCGCIITRSVSDIFVGGIGYLFGSENRHNTSLGVEHGFIADVSKRIDDFVDEDAANRKWEELAEAWNQELWS